MSLCADQKTAPPELPARRLLLAMDADITLIPKRLLTYLYCYYSVIQNLFKSTLLFGSCTVDS